MPNATVLGAGLAGCEAAWQLAERGIDVRLIEMKPHRKTPAHHSNAFAELVCSNSLRANDLTNAAGLLKEELRRAGGLILRCADATRTPAGGALAVDREAFAQMVTEQIRSHPRITIEEAECTTIPSEGHVIVATGPLTSDALFAEIHQTVGGEFLHFYDAAAPIVSFESIDMHHAYFASRYDKGTPDYINCPLNKEEYDAFWHALTTAEEAPVHGFEDSRVFEGCMPVEVMGRRGYETLLFGPMKPVGLPDPKTGKDPFAVLQLRKDNQSGSLYNLVGFQTHLKFGEQKRVFSMIPALQHAEFVRYGVMHRNTFIDSPRLLDHTYALRKDTRIRFAGQITGVEGYIESNASGWLAGVATACALLEKPLPNLPKTTAIGALAHYVSDETVTRFQPMNINFGILAPLQIKFRGKNKKQEKNLAIASRALDTLTPILEVLP